MLELLQSVCISRSICARLVTVCVYLGVYVLELLQSVCISRSICARLLTVSVYI